MWVIWGDDGGGHWDKGHGELAVGAGHMGYLIVNGGHGVVTPLMATISSKWPDMPSSIFLPR